MADITDRATEREQQNRDDAMAAMARVRLSGTSATHCVNADCGEAIPQARRTALPGVQHCITCAELIEFKNKKRRAA